MDIESWLLRTITHPNIHSKSPFGPRVSERDLVYTFIIFQSFLTSFDTSEIWIQKLNLETKDRMSKWKHKNKDRVWTDRHITLNSQMITIFSILTLKVRSSHFMIKSPLISSGSCFKTLPIAVKKSVETNPLKWSPASVILILPFPLVKSCLIKGFFWFQNLLKKSSKISPCFSISPSRQPFCPYSSSENAKQAECFELQSLL